MQTQDVSYAEPVEVSDATFTNEVLQSPVPVLVDCWAPWCGPCQRMLQVMHQLAGDLAGEVKVAKLNVDQNPAVSRQLGIRSVPTLLLFQRGNVIGQLLGAPPPDAHAERIHKNIDYTISTHSNHTISEAFGLWLVGTLYPELKDSEKYLSLAVNS